MKPTLLVGIAGAVLAIVLVLACDPRTPQEAPPEPRAGAAVARPADADARLLARKQAGAELTRKMRALDRDIRVTSHGQRHTVLRLTGRNCSAEVLVELVRDSGARLREMGFERVECRGRLEGAEVPL